MSSDRTRTDHNQHTLNENVVDGGDTSQHDQDKTRYGDSLNCDFEIQEEQLQQIGKFECRGLIGKGGMGAVYLAFDPLLEREVALKVLPKDVSEDESVITRFLVEARAIGQLSHPNVIAIHDVGEQDGRFFIVTELARGGNVASLIKQQGRMPLDVACRVTIEAARGLQAAHNAGIVHRDVKPENLMLSGDGLVKLVDFGLAKAIDRSRQLGITTAGQILGTPTYMAPEQIEDGVVDGRTDIYSLGATFYHLITGHPPFERESLTKVLFAHVGSARPDPHDLVKDIPRKCSDIVAKAMAIDPDARYQTMAELIKDIESIQLSPAHRSTSSLETQAVDLEQVSPRVILTEPSRFLANRICEFFENTGCHVSRVSTPEDAIALVREQPFEIAITSRQLAGLMGEQLLRNIRTLSGPVEVACVMTSSESPDELVVQDFIDAPAAYVRKQGIPEEVLRAIYACTGHLFLKLPFRVDKKVDISVGILSEDSSAPDELGRWLADLGITDVTCISLSNLAHESMRDRDLILWVDRSSETESEFAARLVGTTSQKMIRKDATVAIIDARGSGMTLRGVKRFAFQSTCNREFNQETLDRLLKITTKLDTNSESSPDA